jgi:hypothetical protein
LSVLAAIRPDAWNLPLLLHVLGAMVLVGTLVLAASALVLSRRDGSVAMLRLGHRSLLLVALPAQLVMRGAAEWIADKEGLTGDEAPSWVDIGYGVAETGLLVLLASILLTGLALRRAGRPEGSSGDGLSQAATVLVTVILAAYLVAIWAMTAQPA